MRVRIRGIAKGGDGVGHVEEEGSEDRRTWFVEGGLPGELLVVQAIKTKRRVVRAEVREVIEAAPERVGPPCPLARRCGGCDWQHVRPEAQAQLKHDIVAGQLRRLDPPMQAPAGSPMALGYRRRARVHYRRTEGGLQLGFHRRHSHDIENHERCIVLDPVLDAAIQRLRQVEDALLPAGEVHGISDGERAVLGLPRLRPDRAPLERFESLLEGDTRGLVGIVLRGGRKRHTLGRAELDIDGGKGVGPMRVGPFMFAQAQSPQNAALMNYVVDLARPQGKVLLELYAGAGNFTRRLARGAQRLRAVDDARESIAALRRMAQQRGLDVDAKASSVDRFLAGYGAGAPRYDVIVLDPPRGGVGKKGAGTIARLAKERIVYVSCDPATLNRDLEAMLAARPELRLRSVRVFDMMPMTSECETVVCLEVGA